MNKLVLATLAFLPMSVMGDVAMSGNGNQFVDQAMVAFMQQNNVPGMSLALVRDGVLVMARGYGIADEETGRQVEPTDRFRLASVSKSITSTAIMKLEEAGHLSLQDPALVTWLPQDLALVPQFRVADFASITIENLLSHTSGWEFRSIGRELVFEQRGVAEYFGVESPASRETVIDYAMQFEGLHHPVGQVFAYENFNYLLAGRVLESVSHRNYEDFVRSRVLAPLGIKDMQIGPSLESDLGEDEVRYHPRGMDAIQILSVFDANPVQVPVQYGGWDQQGIDSAGGWTASAVEMARLLSALDGTTTVPDLLSAETIQLMGARPNVPAWDESDVDYYGMGWFRVAQFGPVGNVYYHNGSLPGTATLVAFQYGTNAVVALMNTREDELNAMTIQALLPVFSQPESWPDEDLFADYGMQDFVASDEVSGAWYDPAHDGEGFVVEILDSRTAVVYWFTYDEIGNQRWFIGVGNLHGGTIDVPALLEVSGGKFGNEQNNVTESVIGNLKLEYDSCDSGVARYEVEGVQGMQQLTRLTGINGHNCPDHGSLVHLPSERSEVSSGNWFRPQDPGEGMIFQRLDDQSAVVFWFTFDLQGNPAWMVGVGERDGNNWRFSDLEITSGGRFGADFNPADVERESWGSLTLSFTCLEGHAEYVAIPDNFTSDSQALSRLAWLAGEFCPD